MDRLGATFRKIWIVNMLNNRPLIKNRELHLRDNSVCRGSGVFDILPP